MPIFVGICLAYADGGCFSLDLQVGAVDQIERIGLTGTVDQLLST